MGNVTATIKVTPRTSVSACNALQPETVTADFPIPRSICQDYTKLDAFLTSALEAWKPGIGLVARIQKVVGPRGANVQFTPYCTVTTSGLDSDLDWPGMVEYLETANVHKTETAVWEAQRRSRDVCPSAAEYDDAHRHNFFLSKNLGTCWNRYTCRNCGSSHEVDSSD